MSTINKQQSFTGFTQTTRGIQRELQRNGVNLHSLENRIVKELPSSETLNFSFKDSQSILSYGSNSFLVMKHRLSKAFSKEHPQLPRVTNIKVQSEESSVGMGYNEIDFGKAFNEFTQKVGEYIDKLKQ